MKDLLHALVWTRRHLAGELRAPELTPLLRYLSPADVVLDVGGHAGSWAVPASRVLTTGRVYAFEALPYYGRVLKLTLRLLGRRNVTVVVAAVTDVAGEVSVIWRDAAGRRLTGRTHMDRGNESGDAVTVRAITIDEFCGTHNVARVRLIKCDVEGAELMVLRGAAQTIAMWRPLVFCELYQEYCDYYGYAPADVFSFFAARDYRPMQFDDGGFRALDPADYSGTGDVLFMPVGMEQSHQCA